MYRFIIFFHAGTHGSPTLPCRTMPSLYSFAPAPLCLPPLRLLSKHGEATRQSRAQHGRAGPPTAGARPTREAPAAREAAAGKVSPNPPLQPDPPRPAPKHPAPSRAPGHSARVCLCMKHKLASWAAYPQVELLRWPPSHVTRSRDCQRDSSFFR